MKRRTRIASPKAAPPEFIGEKSDLVDVKAAAGTPGTSWMDALPEAAPTWGMILAGWPNVAPCPPMHTLLGEDSANDPSAPIPASDASQEHGE